MKRFFSIILLIMLSAGMIFAQENVTKQPASGTTKTNVATAKPVTKSNDSSQGSATTKESPSSSNTTTSTKTNTSESSGNTQGSSETKGNTSSPTTTGTSTAQTNTSSVSTTANDTTPATTSNVTLDHFIIGGGISAGGVVATNLIGSGLILNAEFEVMVQFKHHRLGIGGDKTLMLTPENLGTVLVSLGKSNRNLNKVYFIYEWTLFKRSPINFTAGLKLGSFDVGASDYKNETKSTERAPFFGSVGIALEVGHPRFLLYIKPEIGIHSYEKVWRYDLFAMATVGFRWKTKRLDKYDSLKTTTEPEKKFE